MGAPLRHGIPIEACQLLTKGFASQLIVIEWPAIKGISGPMIALIVKVSIEGIALVVMVW